MRYLLLLLTCVCAIGQNNAGRASLPLNASVVPTNNLIVWYKADTFNLSDGVTITNITNWSAGGSAKDLTVRVNANNNFLFTNVVAAINGKPAICAATGIDVQAQAVSSSYSTNLTEFTGAVVLKGTHNATYPDITILAFHDVDSSWTLRKTTSSGSAVWSARGKMTGGTSSALVTNALNTWQVITWQWDSTSGTTTVKNNTDTVNSTSTSTGAKTITYAQLQMPETDQCAEFMCYSSKLNSTDLAALRSSLAAKYGLTITP